MGKPVVVLHVGAMKTGTTYLQSKVIANRDALAAAGIDFAGRRWRDQVSAVQDLLDLAQHDPAVEKRSSGAWERMVEHFGSVDARASLLSMEFLSFADEETAREAVASLAGFDVQVVISVRDTAAVMPSLWQTSITSGGVMSWPRYTRVVRASTLAGGRVGSVLARAGLPSARRFAEAIDIPRMIRVWTSVLPPDPVHVVVVPGAGAPRDRLWELFAEVLDVDPSVARAPAENANESLGLPSAELVRRLNAELELKAPTQQRPVKVNLAGEALSTLRPEERRARIDPATFRAAMRWNGRIREALVDSGVRVHGDLADLPTAADPAAYDVDAEQRPPGQEELLNAARKGFFALVARNKELAKEAYPKRRADRYRARVKTELVRPKNWRGTEDPVGAAVGDLADLARSAIRLERKAVKRRKKKRRRRAARRAARRSED